MRKSNRFIVIFLLALLFHTGNSFAQEEFTEYFAQVEDRLLQIKGDYVSITNNKGKTIVPYYKLVGEYMSVFNWDGELYARGDDYFKVTNDEGKMAVFSVKGDLLFDFHYDYVHCVRTEDYDTAIYLFVIQDGDGFTLRDSENNPLFDGAVFDEFCTFWGNRSNQLILLNKGKALYLNTDELSINDSLPSYVKYDYQTVYLPFRGKSTLVDRYGNIIFPPEYDQIGFYSIYDPIFNLKKDDKKGLGFYKGKIIVPVEYEDIRQYCQFTEYARDSIYAPCLGKKNGKYAILMYDDKVGHYLPTTEFVYESLECEYVADPFGYNTLIKDGTGRVGDLKMDGTVEWRK